jgi:hypothetical protein
MGTTALAVLVGFVIIPGVFLAIKVFRKGRAQVFEHWKENLRDGAVTTLTIWLLLFCYHLFYKVPHDIRVEAERAQAPIWTGTSPKPTSVSGLFTQDYPTTMKGSDEAIGIQWKDNGGALHIKRQLYLDFPNSKKFVGFYVPASNPLDVTRTVDACMKLADVDAVREALNDMPKKIAIFAWPSGKATSINDLAFTGRVLIYHDDMLSDSQKAAIVKAFDTKHYLVDMMGPDYLAKRISAWHQEPVAAK